MKRPVFTYCVDAVQAEHNTAFELAEKPMCHTGLCSARKAAIGCRAHCESARHPGAQHLAGR